MDKIPLRKRPLHHKIGGLSFILILILGGFTLWSAFMKPTQDIKVGKGGKAVFYNQRKRFMIPFIEVGVEQNKHSSMGTYIRVGSRFEF